MASEADLDTKYDVLRLSVISSNTITSRTALLLKHLNQDSPDDKRPIASLRAKASVSNKLISSVEIAKRELLQKGQSVYQYSELGFETVNLKTVGTRTSDGKGRSNEDVDADGKDDDAFEVMRGPEKVRDMPVLTVYLSLASIKELRDTLGEQAERC